MMNNTNQTQSTRTSRKGRALTTMVAAVAAASMFLAGPAASAAVQLKDNKPGSAHHAAVQWMAEEGITAGDTKGNFNKNQSVTRGMTAAFLYYYKTGGPSGPIMGSSPFVDVNKGGANYAAIHWVDRQGIAVGSTDGRFRQSKPVTRGEFAAFLYRMANPNFTAPKTSKLTDIKHGGANYEAITWMSSEGITSGYADGAFKQSKSISRAEMAAFLFAYDKQVGQGTGNPKPADPKPTQPAEPKPTTPAQPEPTEPTQPKPTEPSNSFPAWYKGATTVATAPAGMTQEQRANYYMDHYGCEDISVQLVPRTELGIANGMATLRDGSPASVRLVESLPDRSLNSTAAHECMHALQHEVSGYNRAASEAILSNWYDPGYVNPLGKTVNVFEQNAECALRTLGLSAANQGYGVKCDARGLHAGWAIASGLNPNSVPFKG